MAHLEIVFQVRRLQSISIFPNLNHPCSVCFLLLFVFYLNKRLFYGFLRFEGDGVNRKK